MKKKYFFATLCALSVLLFSVEAFCQVNRVRIMEVDDLNLGNWPYSSMTGNDPVCVYRNNGINTYQTTVTDNSTISPATFNLENATRTAQIPYQLYWGNTPAPGTILLADGVTLPASGANITASNCGGGDSANFKVTINNSDLAAVPSGTYTATVTMVVRP